MRFIFYSHPTFEPWDWRNPEEPGIGGSETSHIEMAQRLAADGHEVFSFAPIPAYDVEVHLKEARFLKPDFIVGPSGVRWAHSDYVDFSLKGIWVLYRHPQLVDQIPKEGNSIWLICQDAYYDSLTAERAAKFDRIVALCRDQADFFKARYKSGAAAVCQSSNGIKAPTLESIKRNPKRMMYASSPDRGLNELLTVYERVKELVPEAELHVFYGFDNIEKYIARDTTDKAYADYLKRQRDVTLQKMERLGVEWHGRTGQSKLAIEWLKSGLWVHPSDFQETSCITCMDAQALGAIPITTPIWAVRENVKHGIFIEGSPRKDPMIRAQYVWQTFHMLLDEQRQEEIRKPMMPWAREQFHWSRFVRQWEEWAQADTVNRSYARAEEVTA